MNKKYQLCTRDDKNAVSFDWNRVPEEIINNLRPEFIYNILGLKETGDIETKSVIYFKQVDNFEGNITIIQKNEDNIEFGI